MTPTEEVTESNTMVADFNEATTGGDQISPFPPITPEDLSTDVSAAKVPELTPDTSMDGFDAMLEDDGVSNQLEQKAQESKTTRDQSLDDLIKSALETPGETELTDRAYRRDVDPLERELNDINDQIRREKLSMRRRIESIQSRGGGLKTGAQAEIANIQRESLSKQADLSIIQMAAQGRYDSAKEIADRAVSVQLEKDRRKNEVLQFVYDENKELFTTDEKRAFEQKQLERNRRYELKKNQAELVQNTKLDAIKMAQMNGAPVSVLSAIQGAKTAEEVLSLAGQWGSVDMLERQIKNTQLSNALKQGRVQDYELAQLDAAEKRRENAIAVGELLPEQFEEVDKVDKEFRSEPLVKEFNEASSKRFAFEQVINEGVNGVQDLLLVYEFMKAVDPTSVVRETEFDNAAKSGNIFSGVYEKFNQGYFGEGGFLPPEVKASFLDSANAAYAGKQKQYFNVKDEFGKKINRRFSVDNGANYLTSYEDAAPLKTVPIENAKIGDIVEKENVRYRKIAENAFEQIND